MKLIIDISEENYKNIEEQVDKRDYPDMQIGRAIVDGTPLPEGHGRLIDEERLKETIHRNVVGDLFDELIDMQPTIIEAESEEE